VRARDGVLAAPLSRALRALPALYSLGLEGGVDVRKHLDVRDDVASAICSLTALTQLKLQQVSVTLALAKHVTALIALADVRLCMVMCDERGMTTQLLRALARLPALARLYLAHLDSASGGDDDAAVGAAIGSMRALSLQNISLERGRAAVFMPRLKALCRLTALTTRRCALYESSAIAATTVMLLAMPQLVSLDLTANTDVPATAQGSPGSAFATVLAPVLRKLTRLQDLRLSSTKAAPAGVRALTPALQQLCALTCLRFECNAVGAEGAVPLGAALARLPQLRELRVGGNLLCGSGAAALVAALARLRNLAQTRLDLRESGAAGSGSERHNISGLFENLGVVEQLGAGVAEALRVGLEEQRQASAAVAGTGDVGAALAPLLAPLSELRMLNVAKCEIGVAGLRELAAAAAALPALTRVQLSDNKLGAAGAAALEPLFKRPLLPLCLEVHAAELGDSGAEALARGAAACPGDVFLQLGTSPMQARSRRALAAHAACDARVTMSSDGQQFVPDSDDDAEL
jgi:Leucine Rich repeat